MMCRDSSPLAALRERADDGARQIGARVFALGDQVLEHDLHAPQVRELALDLPEAIAVAL